MFRRRFSATIVPTDSLPPQTPIDLARRPNLALAGASIEPSVLAVAGPRARVTVEPRVMQVLLALADADGAVLARDTLMDRCWGNRVVGEDALNRAVAGVRRVLRQAGLEQAITVETIPRVGYRLQPTGDAAVTDLRPPDAQNLPDAAAVGHAPAAAPDLPSKAGRRLALGATLAALAAGAGVFVWRQLSADPALKQAQALMSQADQALRLARPDADRRAADLLAQASQHAPSHAPAWGQLALARRLVAESAPPDEYLGVRSAAEDAIARALALDPRQPDALAAKALLVPVFGAWTRVDEALRAVLEIAPGHLPTLDALAFLLAGAGVLAGHYPMRQKTVHGDPFHAGYNFRSIYSHWMNGDLGAADRAGERGLDLWPGHFPTWIARCDLFAFSGRPERALAMFDEAARMPPLPPPLTASMRSSYTALISGRAADRAAARETVLRSVAAGGPLMAVNASLLLAGLGEVALALDVSEAYLLERGPIAAGTSWRAGQPLHNDLRRRMTNYLFLPVMAPVREDPRFAVIVRDIGLGAYWQRPERKPDYLGTRAVPV
jgi:DNA-binding winged helix-turn-helix (wHTH) protein